MAKKIAGGFTRTDSVYIDKQSRVHRFLKFTPNNRANKIDAYSSIKKIYDTAMEKYGDKIVVIRAMTPLGPRTVATSLQGMLWQNYDDYIDGRVRRKDKFLEGVDEIWVDIMG